MERIAWALLIYEVQEVGGEHDDDVELGVWVWALAQL